ncbi:hypothetical protein M1B72_19485 [Geomonas paludis]|uniref:Uncharacterized protein n=1 Tax=Geomonas paludis TaxID=2740185 RepID=A0A6V8MRS5_9BACT|nr:hypothetical protein [Geomonas paludis]UPU35596.1 hypothetical protein M1B72_19485 [Geomonas paludis]GFO62826.1 hypothetical protein GMPD_07450 [Geomonas paludis]
MSTKDDREDTPERVEVEPSKLRGYAENRAEEIASGSDAAPGEPGDASCRTRSLVPAFSICLPRKRSCPYAMSFGHQYLCRHPDHAKFLVPPPKHKK